MTAAPAAPPHLAGRQVEVETPEHVAIGYELADLGSRFAALLVDGIVLSLGVLVLTVGIPLLAVALGGPPDGLAGIGIGLIIFLVFAWIWGYFVYFEGLRDGQTPGKRWLRIRVVHDGGFPVTVRGAAIRNLLRLVDIQPAPSWMVGGLAMMLHPQTKRVGDLAAGTVVVRERNAALLPEEQAQPGAASGPPRLSAGELETLGQYVARREQLRPEVRHG
ncbi:MAG: RDD family protein, partial [Gemmatimonadota bacterium]|nr:RDD family protein [Gemmatimonadota bacterium]